MATYTLSRLTLALALASTAKSQDDPRNVGLLGHAWHTSTVLGDFLYLEGGDFYQYVEGEEGPIGLPNYVAQSIPLDESWDAASIPVLEIDRGDKPNVSNHNLWPDTKGNRIFQWDGLGPWGDRTGARSRELWVFSPDGRGFGEWNSQPSGEGSSNYADLTRLAQGAGTTCGDMAYLIGGFAVDNSDDRIEAEMRIPIPGMLTFNMTTGEWRNQSLVDMSPPYGTYMRGKAACFERDDGEAYVFPIGGVTTAQSTVSDERHFSLSNITFYDQNNDKWLWQTTTGDVPPGRERHCVAGARSSNGTYEIFVYGGYHSDRQGFLNDAWVLTIPGFHWIETRATAVNRGVDACNLVGKRQVAIVGGDFDQSGDSIAEYGVGIFDLTELQWTDAYDADADDYESPEEIREWYNNGGLDNVEWSSDEVQSIFAAQTTRSPPDEESDSSDNGGSSSSTPVGAIAGGTVGGVAVVVLLVALVLYYRRRRRSRELTQQTQQQEKPDFSNRAELDTQQHPPVELPSDGHQDRSGVPYGYNAQPAWGPR